VPEVPEFVPEKPLANPGKCPKIPEDWQGQNEEESDLKPDSVKL
jgi:hypothetical protein